MPLRKVKLLVAALAVASTLPAAHADGEPEGQGINTGLAGIVISTDTYEFSHGTFTIVGDCDFNGVIVPFGQDGGGQIVRFRGDVTASGPAVPIVTNITCEIRQAAPGFVHSQDAQFNGNTASTAGSTVNDQSMIWPLQPITVCVSGKAVFGFTPVVEVPLTKRCRTP